jgi:hypothetical protein
MGWDSLGAQLLIVLVPLLLSVLATMRGAHPVAFVISRACLTFIAADLFAWPLYTAFSLPGPHPLEIMGAIFWGAPVLIGLYFALAWVDYEAWINSPYLRPDNRQSPRGMPELPLGNAPIVNPLSVFLGSSLNLATHMPHTVLQMGAEPMIVIDRDRRGRLIIKTLKIFDAHGDIVIWFDDHKYRMGPMAMRPERPDSHTIIVHDRGASEVLRLSFLNPQAIFLTGIFCRPGSQRVSVFPDHLEMGTVTIGTMTIVGARVSLMVG